MAELKRSCFAGGILAVLLLFCTGAFNQVRCENILNNIEQIEAFVSASEHDKDLEKQSTNAELINTAIEKLIQEDKLSTAADFGKAGVFVQIFQMDSLERVAQKYQLLLTAVSLGDKGALKNLPSAWDLLIMATGRDPRVHRHLDLDSQIRTAACIQRVYEAAARGDLKTAKKSKDNKEVAKIVEDDQKARSASWSNLSQAEMKAIGEADRKRFRRIQEIIARNGLETARDFANAALVCQHGQKFDEYALAHELATCALMLGDKNSSWLCGASYDRMLLSGSYLQRFCTQYGGLPCVLRPYTSSGVNDTMRSAVVHKTLEQALERAKHLD